MIDEIRGTEPGQKTTNSLERICIMISYATMRPSYTTTSGMAQQTAWDGRMLQGAASPRWCCRMHMNRAQC